MFYDKWVLLSLTVSSHFIDSNCAFLFSAPRCLFPLMNIKKLGLYCWEHMRNLFLKEVTYNDVLLQYTEIYWAWNYIILLSHKTKLILGRKTHLNDSPVEMHESQHVPLTDLMGTVTRILIPRILLRFITCTSQPMFQGPMVRTKKQNHFVTSCIYLSKPDV